MRQAFSLTLRRGGALAGLVDSPAPEAPAVVIAHGFKGFMEWGFFPALADLLAARGFSAVRFNFTGAGMRPGNERVTDPEAFRAATFSRDREELLELVARLGEIDAGRGPLRPARLGLFGHSRGGGTALLATAGHPVDALVTWSAVSTFDRLSESEKKAWRERGALPVVNARTGQELELGLEVLADLERNAASLDLAAAAAQRTCPWLIVHGERDETVPVAEARRLAGWARAPAEPLTIAGADHTYGARHPLAGPTRELTGALNATQTFFRRHLT